MAIELRPITKDEFPAFQRANLAAFGEGISDELSAVWLPLFEFDRSLAAIATDENNKIVATAGIYSVDLTLPGLTTLPVAGVTWVGVMPTHRRQGILTKIMRRQLDDIAARGEALAILTASESAIYGRFGYGLASSKVNLEIDKRHAAFAKRHGQRDMLDEAGRVELIDHDEALAILPDLYDQARRQQPGAITRSQERWTATLHPVTAQMDGPEPRFFVKYLDASGKITGATWYRIKPHWDQAGPAGTLMVGDLVATTPHAYAALWRYLLSVDLIQTVQVQRRSVDEPLRWLLADPRRLRVTSLTDDLWVRLLDIPAALTARGYSTADRLIFEVADAFRPQTAGRYLLEAGPDGARCVLTSDSADIALDVADLGAAYLGGVRFSTLARAGRVAEQTTGALVRADTLFASTPAPWCGTPF
jgi:predicted acetyltransferase